MKGRLDLSLSNLLISPYFGTDREGDASRSNPPPFLSFALTKRSRSHGGRFVRFFEIVHHARCREKKFNVVPQIVPRARAHFYALAESRNPSDEARDNLLFRRVTSFP